MDITIDGAQFYAVEVGQGEGEPLVALHGGPGLDHRELRPYLDPLGDVARVVYLDQRGQGRSERVAPETCTTDRMIDDVEGLRRHLGAERVAVLGHSFGGFIALGYAERYPERVSRLVLSCTAPSHEMAVEAAANVEQYATPEQRAALESEGAWKRMNRCATFCAPNCPTTSTATTTAYAPRRSAGSTRRSTPRA